jgi:hypothetical protein
MKKVEQYVPKIEDDVPIPPRLKTTYTRKIVDGELLRIAKEMRPTQSVVIPVGSIGKFRNVVKGRGLETVCQVDQTATEARIWVVVPEG